VSLAEPSQDASERLAAEVTRAMPAPPPLPAAEVMAEGGGGGGGGVAATAAHAVTAACVAPTAKRLCAVARLLLMAGATVEEEEESTRTVSELSISMAQTHTQGPRPNKHFYPFRMSAARRLTNVPAPFCRAQVTGLDWLGYAASQGDAALMYRWIAAGGDPASPQTDDGRPALVVALLVRAVCERTVSVALAPPGVPAHQMMLQSIERCKQRR